MTTGGVQLEMNSEQHTKGNTMDKASVVMREIAERFMLLAEMMEDQPEPEPAVNNVATQVVTVSQCAEMIGVSPKTVRTWCMTGIVPGAKQVMVAGRRQWVIPQQSVATLVVPDDGKRVRKSPKQTAATARLRKRWTDSEDAQLMRLLDEGLPHGVIGTMLRRSEKAVTARAAILRSEQAPVAERTDVTWTVDNGVSEPVADHEPEVDDVPVLPEGRPQGLGLWGRFLRGEA